MNHHLQSILNLIQQDESLTLEQKNVILKSLKEADKEFEITAFKLDRTEKVKRTTAILLEETIEELEQKEKAVEAQNRELEIETALEKVRAVAMGMRQPGDMLDVCRIISQQLDLLSVKEIRNVQTAIFDQEKSIYLNYEFFRLHNKTTITEVEYNLQPDVKDFVNQMLTDPEAFFTTAFEGTKLKAWMEYQEVAHQFVDPHLYEVKSLHYYFYSIGPGALGVSTYAPLNGNELAVFKRFRNVFDLAYHRFIDIEQALAQAREAEIEVALEKVRSRSLAMHKSDELQEVVNTVFERLTELDIEMDSANIAIFKKGTRDFDYWVASPFQKRTASFHMPYTELSLTRDLIAARESGIDFSAKAYSFEEKNEWFRYAFKDTDFKFLTGERKQFILDAPAVTVSIAFSKYTGLQIIRYSTKLLSEREAEILKRFSKVFEQAYTRFLDLQKAEAQAREAKVEAALERTRTQSMIMQHSKELDDTLRVFHQQVLLLGINSAFSFLWLPDEKNDRHIFWAAWGEDLPAGQVVKNVSTLFKSKSINYPLDRNEPATAQCLVDWKSNEPVYSYHVPPAGVESYFAAWQELINGVEKLKPEYFSGGLHYVEAFMKYGCFGVMVAPDLTEDEKKILGRFAIEFERTYTRFLDLQKAEAQAREARIENALEKVRSRTMAMQRSNELADVAMLLFQQVKELGITAWTTGFNIWQEDNASYIDWITAPTGEFLEPYTVDLTTHPVFGAIREAKQRGDDFFVSYIEGDQIVEIYELLSSFGDKGQFQKILDSGIQFPTRQFNHFVFGAQVSLLFITYEACPEEWDIFKRFGKVFEQTYTRFLDLQKAEAQARESQIQLAMERVRARTMAMHHSNELAETSSVLFQQIKELGFETWSCGFCIWTKNDMAEVWMAADSGGLLPPMMIPYKEEPTHAEIYKASLRGEPAHDKIWEGKPLEKHYAFLKNIPSVKTAIDILEKSGLTLPSRHCYYVGFFKEGYLLLITKEPNEGLKDLSKRFASVFDLTYTRFLDLQKAEAQVREAQIEAALERVRSRSMGMQKSEELKEVIQVVYDQFVHLNVHVEHTGFIMDYKTRDDMHIWLADKHAVPFQVTIPYFDCAHWNSFNEAKEKGLDFFANHLTFEEKNKFYQDLFKLIPGVPEETLEYYLGCPGLAISTVLLENVGLYIENFSGIPYTDEENNTLMRFGKVFQQTYTRFLDLQKAEAQAREATIEASLERVRAYAMAMHNSADLSSTVNIFFKELKTLGIMPMRCGVGEMNDVTRTSDLVFTTADKQGELYELPGKLKHGGHPVVENIYNYWKLQEEYHPVLQGADINAYYQVIKSQMTLPDFPEYTIHYGNYFYFKEGFFFAWAEKEFTEEAMNIFRRFTSVLSLTYKRYKDLKQAEASAREAQIEAALERVRAKVMGMNSSNDLKETSLVFGDQLKQLGNEWVFSYFWLIEEDKNSNTFWITWPDKKNSVTTYPLADIDEFTQGCLISWRRGDKIHANHLPPAKVGRFLDAFRQLILDAGTSAKSSMKPENFPGGIYYYDAMMKYGSLGVCMNRAATEEENKIQCRFALEFERAYTRFLDLQKAEVQARESQIEASLERVRSKAMAMQKSEDLAAAVAAVFEELDKLNLGMLRCGIGILDKLKCSADIWTTTKSDQGTTVQVAGDEPMNIHPLLQGAFDAWLHQEENFSYVLQGEDMNSFYKAVADTNFQLPDTQSIISETKELKQYYFVTTFQSGGLYAFRETAFPEEAKTLMKRFADVFNFTYTRFSDLKQAEAQTREAIKASSLDRVRAEIASMRTTDDLQLITPSIWKELTVLGLPFFRCGVFIINEKEKKAHVYLSTPDGKPLAVLHLDFDGSDTTRNTVENWRIQKVYTEHWGREQFIAWTQSLIGQGQIKAQETYQGGDLPPESLTLQFVPFVQGMLYVGSVEPLSELQVELVHSLAKAFSTAYSRYEDFNKLELAKEQIEKTLVDLKQAQSQLVQSEKMASLGELTAGIAHEIQNPLNFVNNFSEVSNELISEMVEEIEKGNKENIKAIANDVQLNMEKILHHGKKADAIVKGMMQHSRSSSAVKEPTDINKLADEYLRLAFHGLRAKDKTFNAALKTDYDETIGTINVIPQDIGRVILNLITNAFYAVTEKRKQQPGGYEPTVSVRTKKINGKVEVRVKDNGNGIPQKVLDKIFQPFFTTKPTGQGTGLGLSISYDIVKTHGGEIKVETKEGEGAAFIIQLACA